jgi:hypothetical protein
MADQRRARGGRRRQGRGGRPQPAAVQQMIPEVIDYNDILEEAGLRAPGTAAPAVLAGQNVPEEARRGPTAEEMATLLGQQNVDTIRQFFRFPEVNAEEARQWHNAVMYQGFQKNVFLAAWQHFGFDADQMLKIAFLGAVRGTNLVKIRDVACSAEFNLRDARRVVAHLALGQEQLRGNPVNRGAIITISRCTAVMPHAVAALMRRAGVPARYPNLALPAWLQFPAAAALPLSADCREQHIEFNDRFSEDISLGMSTPDQTANIYAAAQRAGTDPVPWSQWIHQEIAGNMDPVNLQVIRGQYELRNVVRPLGQQAPAAPEDPFLPDPVQQPAAQPEGTN